MQKIRLASLKTRFFMMLSLTLLLPTLAIGWGTYHFLDQYIRTEKVRTVGGVARIKHDQLVTVLSRQNTRAQALLSHILSRCGGRDTQLDRQCANGVMRTYLKTEGAVGALLHQHGISNNLQAGAFAIQINEITAFRPNQLAQFTSPQPDRERQYYLAVAEPETSWQLVVTYSLSLIQSIFVPHPSLGEAGETFLADSNGLFITQARYPSEQGYRDHPVSANPMQSCLSHQHGEVLDEDYRYVPIIHGFRFIPEIGGGCIMAHFSQEEAFAPLGALKWGLAVAAIAFIGFALLVAAYFSRRLVQPLVNLTEVAQAITDGNHAMSTATEGNDEISKLAGAFNHMTMQLTAKERRLNDAQRIAQLGSWELDLIVDKLSWSDQIFRIFEIERTLSSMNFEVFLNAVHPDDREEVKQVYARSLSSQIPYEITHRLRMRDGRVKWVHEYGVTRYDEEGKPLHTSGTVQDITERKQAELAIKASEERYRLIVQTAEEGIWMIDAEARTTFVNPKMAQMLGFAVEEMHGRPAMDFMDEEWRAIAERTAQRRKQGIVERFDFKLRRKNGSELWSTMATNPFFDSDGTYTGGLAMVTDITERKQMEEALRQSFIRLRRLSDHQEMVKENERRRIARDIHDDLGQNLMALKMDVSMLHARTAGAHPRLHQRVDTVLSNINATIKSVKTIMNDLRPATLELGLHAAVEWQMQQFMRSTGIVCKLTETSKDFDPGLSEEQTVAVFRILQESLTNIARHSQASKVEIVLGKSDRSFLMKVADNGIGVQPNDKRKRNAFGLIGIRERIHAFDGELVVESSAGNGTSLSIVIPIPCQESPQGRLHHDIKQSSASERSSHSVW